MKKISTLLPIHNSLERIPVFRQRFYIITFLLFVVCFCLSIFFLLPQTILPTLSPKGTLHNFEKSKTPNFIVVIDPGHGGRDPGKVGTAKTLEKDINLKIALYLKEILENQNIKVMMTRTEDKDLATTDSGFKMSDMKERIAFIQSSNADLVISIHQNSYTDSDIYGAQCFYYSNSAEGKELASFLQKQIIFSTNQTKTRDIKSNNDYYLLKHSTIPTVIVECGFLSNPEEESLLRTDEYQRKMAWAIHLGIFQYLNK